jgi:glycine/D-amino acid oxidase-like deaminating enzyme
MKESPTWKDYERQHFFPSLQANLNPDVFVVGGGLAGLATAYLLNKEGKNVVVLEQKKVGSGATEYTTGFITQDIDTDLTKLIDMFGEEKARLIWQSGGRAIDLVEDIVTKEGIDCEFKRCSAFVYTIKEDGFADLEKESQAAQRLGFEVKAHKDNPFAFKNYGLMENMNQAKFHPLKYLFQLSEILEKKGVKIFENTEVVDLKQTETGWEAKTKEGFVVTANDMILATYHPFSNPKTTFMKKGMYKSYVFEVQLPKNLIPENIYWDDDNPYNYFRIDPKEEYDSMIVGGQDHRAMIDVDEEKNFQALEEYLKFLLPGIDYKIVKRWKGPILEPVDGIALIGEAYPNQYVATAFSGNGMTYSHIAAILLTDLVMQKKNAWQEVYDPKRLPSISNLLKKGKDYVGELFGGAMENVFKNPQHET